MKYQIFVQSQSQQSFVASVVGMSSVTTEGKTEEEAIAKAKLALESQLARGKFVSVEVPSDIDSSLPIPQMKHMGILANDPSFDDFMDKLRLIREKETLRLDS